MKNVGFEKRSEKNNVHKKEIAEQISLQINAKPDYAEISHI